jgi:hypothetical protein
MGYDTLCLSWIQLYSQAIHNDITCHWIAIPTLFHLGVKKFRSKLQWGSRLLQNALWSVLCRVRRELVWNRSGSPVYWIIGISLQDDAEHWALATFAPFSALQHFLVTLEVWHTRHYPDDPMIATTCNNIGQVVITQKEYHQAVSCLAWAMQIPREQLRADHADTAWTVYLGFALSNLNIPQCPLPFYKEFLKCWTKFSRMVCSILSIDFVVSQIENWLLRRKHALLRSTLKAWARHIETYAIYQNHIYI